MPDAVDVAVWWATPLLPTDSLLGLLDPAEQGRYAAYRRAEDQRRFLTGRVLARHIVGERLGVEPAAVPLDATCPDCGKPHGRPLVVGSALELSISHAGDRVGLALTTGVAVGLDVESIDRASGDELLRYALTDAEYAVVSALPPEERSTAFFTYWTRKEAVMKATGRGLRLPLRGIELSPPGEPAALRSADSLDPAATAFADLDPGPGYRAALAALTPGPLAVTEHQWARSHPR